VLGENSTIVAVTTDWFWHTH